MLIRLVIQNVVWIVVMGAILFASAGTLAWPAAWVFLGAMAVVGFGCGLWLMKVDPALLAERLGSMAQKNQPAADKRFIFAIGALGLAWLVLVGLDRRFDLSNVPVVLQAAGLALLLGSVAFSMWVMRTNSFAAPVVKIQNERGQHVIDSGPYAYVRHPMYSGAGLYFASAALLLGSWWGVVLAPLFLILFGYRTIIEEKVLIDGLPGYTDYAGRVRYRLLPGVW